MDDFNTRAIGSNGLFLSQHSCLRCDMDQKIIIIGLQFLLEDTIDNPKVPDVLQVKPKTNWCDVSLSRSDESKILMHCRAVVLKL